MTEHQKVVRCAIYTRKSSEEGLEQSFNSLDAQREACQAYILSQRQEGWRAVHTHYDDGGYSGGNIDRPALQHLLADIKARKVDTVVVYKVDRLTRSLADFAKIIETLDAHHVSFVSVTQQFNTTSSMGRLTLNVLLSFAQFEREVTGERIRDKIAASKRKGMWMGGQVPLGYDLKERQLIVHPEEAKVVRDIFRLYCSLGCVKRLKAQLDRRGIMTKSRLSRSGRRSGGASFSRGALYHLLKNRIYLGEIPHKDQCYPGTHEPLVDRDLWEKVQQKLKENANAHRHGSNASEPSPLRGLIFDADGNRYTPSHAVKNGRRYRYYASQRVIKDAADVSTMPGRLPAADVEGLVVRKLKSFLSSPDSIAAELGSELNDDEIHRTVQAAKRLVAVIDKGSSGEVNQILSTILTRIVIGNKSIELHIKGLALKSSLCGQTPRESAPNTYSSHAPVVLKVSAELRQCRGEKRIILPNSDGGIIAPRPVLPLVKAVTRAHEWIHLLISGECKDLHAISLRTGLDQRYVSRILPLAFLAPEVVEAVLDGRQRPETTIDELRDLTSCSWAEQRSLMRQPNL